MITNFISRFARPKTFIPQLSLAHTETCPKNPLRRANIIATNPKRAEHSGKVRLGFIPDEWFLFFHSRTGVSGPYLFGIMVTNYLVSKEIYILEHEYYTGISIFIMIYYATTRFGTQISKVLDKEVDDYVDMFEEVRNEEISAYDTIVKDGKDAQWRAEGQKLLIDAKKENVVMQLEAAYRERMMLVYQSVKSRLEYHVEVQQTQARIHQKWMINWILDNVMKSITPEIEKQLLDNAIQDLSVLADKSK